MALQSLHQAEISKTKILIQIDSVDVVVRWLTARMIGIGKAAAELVFVH